MMGACKSIHYYYATLLAATYTIIPTVLRISTLLRENDPPSAWLSATELAGSQSQVYRYTREFEDSYTESQYVYVQFGKYTTGWSHAQSARN